MLGAPGAVHPPAIRAIDRWATGPHPSVTPQEGRTPASRSSLPVTSHGEPSTPKRSTARGEHDGPPNLIGDTPDGAHRRPWQHSGTAHRGARPSGLVEREWEGAKASRCSGEHNACREGWRGARWCAGHASHNGAHAKEGEDGGELLTVLQNSQGGVF